VRGIRLRPQADPKELARQALADFLENSKAENLIADEKMVAALQSWQGSDATPLPVSDAPGLEKDEAPLAAG